MLARAIDGVPEIVGVFLVPVTDDYQVPDKLIWKVDLDRRDVGHERTSSESGAAWHPS